MPSDSEYPKVESIRFFEEVIRTHSAVQKLETRGRCIYVVHRKKFDALVVVLTDIYIIGIADLVGAKQRASDLDAVVTISNWNGYIRAAKEHGIEEGVGVFILGEFMGALHKQEPFRYVKLDEKGRPIHHYRD
jgi:hypothetical protein